MTYGVISRSCYNKDHDMCISTACSCACHINDEERHALLHVHRL